MGPGADKDISPTSYKAEHRNEYELELKKFQNKDAHK